MGILRGGKQWISQQQILNKILVQRSQARMQYAGFKKGKCFQSIANTCKSHGI